MASYYKNPRANFLGELPLVDKATMMASFGLFNKVGLAVDHAWQIAETTGRFGEYFVGKSTGTSGNRGLYIISDRERYEWLGTILAKLLPRYPHESARVALALPLDSALYQAARKIFRMELRFFDLHVGLEEIARQIEAFAPDTMVAPPKVLRFLAEGNFALKLRKIFSVAEVLDDIDRNVIEARFNQSIGQVYMATEGLLATTCRHHTLHLAEDVMHFELIDVPGSALVTPVITDFTRRTQIMARYQMNDLLRMSSKPCECGSPLLCVDAVIGRNDDIFRLTREDGNAVCVTPDIIRNAILESDRSILDFRVIQTERDKIEIFLPDGISNDAIWAARQGVTQVLFGCFGLAPQVVCQTAPLTAGATKLRRVHRSWAGE